MTQRNNPMQMIMGQAMPNNPFIQMVSMVRGGGNPQQLMAQMIQQNPRLNQALPFVQGKTPDKQKETFFAMCKERGIDPVQFAHQLGIDIK